MTSFEEWLAERREDFVVHHLPKVVPMNFKRVCGFINTHRTAAGVELTLTEIAGRVDAIDAMCAFGGTWSNVVTFSNFTGQVTFEDTNGIPGSMRFYRGRLVR